MAMLIHASEHINPSGWPIDQGAVLADALLAKYPQGWSEFTVILDMTPAMLIGGFFNAFLQRVHDAAPALLDDARKTKWHAPFAFQRDLIANWCRTFSPVEDAGPKG